MDAVEEDLVIIRMCNWMDTIQDREKWREAVMAATTIAELYESIRVSKEPSIPYYWVVWKENRCSNDGFISVGKHYWRLRGSCCLSRTIEKSPTYLFYGQPVGVHRLLVLERTHERIDDVADVEHAHGRTADGVHGRIEHAVHDGIDDTSQSCAQYVTGALCAKDDNNVFTIMRKLYT